MQKILFDHVPKCGGNTLGRWLSSHYKIDQIYAISGTPHIETAKYINMPKEMRKNYYYIWGHEAHQLLNYLPNPYILITILRDPVDRIVSYYYWAKRDPGHYLYEAITKNNMDLTEFSTSGLSSELSNYYTSHFSNMPPGTVRSCPEEALETAKNNLARYEHIGFTHNLNAFIASISKSLDLTNPYDGIQLNKTFGRKSLDNITQQERECIAESNKIDIELYTYALQLK